MEWKNADLIIADIGGLRDVFRRIGARWCLVDPGPRQANLAVTDDDMALRSPVILSIH